MLPKSLKIIFVIRSPEVFHHYQSIVRALASRGHKLALLFDPRWSKGESFEAVEALEKSGLKFSRGSSEVRSDAWRTLLFYTRELLSFRRYLVVEKRKQSRYYRDRWESYLPGFLRFLLRRPGAKRILASESAASLLKAIERAAPPASNILSVLRAAAPDVLLAGPVNLRFSSADLEYAKAAAVLGIPTVIPVVSWDNLTTKGLFHVLPDRLLVWNEVQREEALEHQFFPEERIRIIGAPLFDGWFDGIKPSLDRGAFCVAHNLSAGNPFILYLGSSRNMAEDETWLVKKLREALDRSQAVKEVQIVVRPHPANYGIYEKLKIPGITVIPRKGALPDTAASRQLFYDTALHACATVVGANTTAAIDACVIGKPGIAYLSDTYTKTQAETSHFRQLLEAGIFELVRSDKEFVEAVSALAGGSDRLRLNREKYLARYIRPLGRDKSAGEAAAEEIENLARRKKRSN